MLNRCHASSINLLSEINPTLIVPVGPEAEENSMDTAKQKMTEVIQSQPDDASYEEIMRELALDQMITSGLKDSRLERTVSNKEMEQRIHKWRK